MGKKVIFLDYLTLDSNIQVGSHKYVNLFRKKGYEVFSLSHYVNIYRFFRRNSEDKELIKSWCKGVQTSREGIFYYSPFCLFPYLNLPILNSIKNAHKCLKFCYPNLRKILEQKDFINVDLLFVNNITLISVLKFVKPRIIVTRISDRFERFKNTPRTMPMLQEEVIKNSNLVFATSRNLETDARRINKNTFYLPNGTDEEFIMKENEEYPLPEEFRNIKKPIVIYVGAISDWFDYKLYEYGFTALKNVSFVMIGPISGVNYRDNMGKIKRLSKLFENFHYLGPKSHSELSGYLAHANLGVIPFIINPLTNEINPIKFFEYAGFGLPVIAPCLFELQNYEGNVLFYKNKEEYANLINNYSDKKAYLSKQLIEFARCNSWEKRFAFMFSKL